MKRELDLSIIYIRPDGSYVVNQGMYHVPNEGEYAELWAQVDAYTKEHSEVVMPEPSEPKPTFNEVKTAALSLIDSSTQYSILAGFEYTINNEYLHFSYQYEDQQNFSDTFNAIAMKKLMGVDSLPDTIGWNGWRNHTNTNKGELVRLNLDVDSFLELYTKGALAHKSYHMTIHGERKKAIESTQSVEEINVLLKEWSV